MEQRNPQPLSRMLNILKYGFLKTFRLRSIIRIMYASSVKKRIAKLPVIKKVRSPMKLVSIPKLQTDKNENKTLDLLDSDINKKQRNAGILTVKGYMLLEKSIFVNL